MTPRRAAAMRRGGGRRPAGRLSLAATSLAIVACSGAERHVVEIGGFEFRPVAVRAAVGDTIVFVNRDMVPHTATDRGGRWDTGVLQAGASGSIVVGERGSVSYVCTLHPSMTATMVVR